MKNRQKSNAIREWWNERLAAESTFAYPYLFQPGYDHSFDVGTKWHRWATVRALALDCCIRSGGALNISEFYARYKDDMGLRGRGLLTPRTLKLNGAQFQGLTVSLGKATLTVRPL